MGIDIFKRIFPVKKQGDIFIITGGIQTELKPKFLARNPEDDELFLLYGTDGSYSLLKGNLARGLRLCKAKGVHLFSDCIAFFFEQDGKLGIITDPDDIRHQSPLSYQSPLQIVQFKIE